MVNNKFYADCWRKIKEDMGKACLNYKIDDTKEKRLKVTLSEHVNQYLLDIENDVKNKS